LADGLEPEHVVEGRDREAVRRCQTERVRDLAEGLRRQTAAVLDLGELQRRHDGRQGARILRAYFLDPFVQRRFGHYRSTSPMTPSREPTIAIRSATAGSRMQVAVS